MAASSRLMTLPDMVLPSNPKASAGECGHCEQPGRRAWKHAASEAESGLPRLPTHGPMDKAWVSEGRYGVGLLPCRVHRSP